MKSNIPKHSCANKCTDFKEEQCKTCLVQDRNIKQWYDVPNHRILEQSEKYDFLTGDVVCITESWRPHMANLYVFDNVIGDTAQVSLFTSSISRAMAIAAGFCISIENIRHASVAELNAKRRLSESELAMAEVS